MIVVDTNILAYLFIDTPFTSAAERLRAREEEWAAPILWRSEFRNTLALYLHQSLITIDEAVRIQGLAESHMLDREYTIPSNDVLILANASGCSAYDCEFAALAFQLDCQLITMDKKLARAFPQIARILVDL